MVELAAAMEEMGRGMIPGPCLSGLLAGAILDAAASPGQKNKYLAPLCRGEKKSTLALLESSARWDAAGVKMKALDGKKMFVPDAAVADFLIVAARAGSDLALFVVDGKAPGVCVKPAPAMDATRKLYEVAFNGADGELLASGAEAEAALCHALDVATVALVAEM